MKGRERSVGTLGQGPASDGEPVWRVESPETGGWSEERGSKMVGRLGALLEPWPRGASRSRSMVAGSDRLVGRTWAVPLEFCTFVTCLDRSRGYIICEIPQIVDYGSINVTVEALLDLLVGGKDSPSCGSCGGGGWGHVRWFVGSGVAVRVYVTEMERVVVEENRGAGVAESLDPRLEVRQVLEVLRRLAMDPGGTNQVSNGSSRTSGTTKTCVNRIRLCVARRRAASGMWFEVGGDAGLLTRMVFDPSSDAQSNTYAWKSGTMEEGWMGRWLRGLVGSDVDVAAVAAELREGGYAGWDGVHWEYAGRTVQEGENQGGDREGMGDKTRVIRRDSDFLWDGTRWRFLYGDDLYSAIIAAFLSSSIYQTFCRDHCDGVRSSSGEGKTGRWNPPDQQQPTSDDDVEVTRELDDARDTNDAAASSSIKIVIDGLIFESHAEVQFHAMRERYIPGGHAAFVLSLMNCHPWSLPSSGGKSKAYFSKSHCGKYVVKQISRTEFESFLEFAGAYFGFMGEYGASSLMAKVFGVFTITVCPIEGTGMKTGLGGMGSMTGMNASQSRAHRARKEMHFVVTENLLGCVEGDIECKGANDNMADVDNDGCPPVIYDLKGVCGRRAKPVPSRDAAEQPTQTVYLDGDMVDLVDEEPLLVRARELEDFQARLERDTAFLASINVMDYSLLCALLYPRNARQGESQDAQCSDQTYQLGGMGRGRPHTMRVGIIDYLRDFTVEKRLESHLKRGLVGEEMTTVVEPARYARRFVDSMMAYFGARVPGGDGR